MSALRALTTLKWSTLLAALLLLLATDAQASSVFADVHPVGDEFSGPVTFRAAHGEANRLTVRSGRWGVVFRDSGSRVQARGKCKSLGLHRATCRTPGYVSAISLGDGDDSATLPASMAAAVYGGRGDDDLSGGFNVRAFGGRGDDVLRGGPGSDELHGGRGRDRLRGRGGDDRLIDGETDAHAARDLFDAGGNGDFGDTVDFTLRHHRLRIDLASGDASTGDTIVGIESVTGGAGDDRLSGNASANSLGGGPGDDRVDGGPGDDVVMGGSGDDHVIGGPGRDTIWGNGGRDRLEAGPGDDLLESHEADESKPSASRPDMLTCGEGADGVVSDASDTLESECELLWAGDARIATVPVLRNDRADFAVTCLPGRGYSGTVALHSEAGAEYGQAPFAVPAAGATTVSVLLNPAGVAALRAGTVLRVDVVPAGHDPPTANPVTWPSGYRMFMRVG
jgi:Ca2+-binding RTX toxin-like protein